MPTAAIHPVPQNSASAGNAMQPRPQLRRAVYVHVSDLTSTYNIDHALLEEQLARVKAIRENKVDPSPHSGVPTELDTSIGQKRLQAPRGGYNLCVLVGKVDVVVDKHRVDGSRVRLAEVEVGDETGVVSLRGRDLQIDLLQEISERSGAVVLRNCTLELFQGKHIRLAITKWGKMSPYPDHIASTPAPPSKMNADRHFSLIDLSVVASEMVAYPQGDPYRRSPDVETQGSSSSSGRMQQSYQQGSSQGGRIRGGGRRPSRGKGGGNNGPVHYQRQEAGVMRYQGGLHGYGYNEGMEARQYAGYGQQRQPEPMASTQMLLQHQYAMQHRQMQQIYHNPPPPQDRQRSLQQPTSSMLLPSVPGAAAFDRSYPGAAAEAPMSPHSMNPFLAPIQGSPQGSLQQPQQQTPQQQQQVLHQQQTPYSSSGTGSPRMNPQAATFDPTYGKVDHK